VGRSIAATAELMDEALKNTPADRRFEGPPETRQEVGR